MACGGHHDFSMEEDYVEPVPATCALMQTEAEHTAKSTVRHILCSHCSHCSKEPVHPYLRSWRGKKCPNTCAACMSCIRKFALDRLEDGEYKCPAHRVTKEPIIGGKNAYALIIQQADNGRVGICTRMDAIRMVELASHPEFMQVPYKNVYAVRIPPVENTAGMEKATKIVNQALQKIHVRRPDRCSMYYTGHPLVGTGKKKCKPFVEMLQQWIYKIGKKCPHILLIIDCCYAAAVAKLLCSRYEIDDDMDGWNIQLMSSTTNELSGAGPSISIFTKMLIQACKGGYESECPSKITNCSDCMLHIRSCSEKGYVSGYDIAAYLSKHSGQRGEVNIRCRRVEPIISFFNAQSKLYNVAIQFQHDQKVEIEIDDVLNVQEILRLAKADQQDAHHLKFYERPESELSADQQDAHHLKVYERPESELSAAELGIELRTKLIGHFDARSEYMPNDLCRGILEAVSKNSKCLLIKIDDTPVQTVDDFKSPAPVFRNTCIFSPPAYYDK